MNATKYNFKEHYSLISQWWVQHNWPTIPADHLPKTGFIIYDKTEPIIAGFVYKTDSAFGLFEFIVANPNIKGLRRDLGFSLLTSVVVDYSKEMGIKSLFSSVSNQSLIKKMLSAGFIETDKNMTNFIKRIG